MPAATSVTAEQFLAFPDRCDERGNRIKEELIEGEIVPMAPACRRHDLIKNRTARLLARYFDSRDSHLDVLVEIAYYVSENNVDIPDVSVVRRSRLSGEAQIIAGAPEIAIEVVSPADTVSHMKSKVDAYLANGSESVWVVYPEQQSIVVHSRGSIREFRVQDRIEDPPLPGFDAVSAFFEV